MARTTARNFAPPTAEQLRSLLERYPPRRPSRVAAWTPLAVLGAALALTVSTDNAALLLLPWVMLGGLFGWLAWRVHYGRQLEGRTTQVQELALLRRWRESLRAAWRLLPSLTTAPELHGRTIAFIAHSLDQLKANEAAIVAYGYLIDHMSPDHPGAIHMKINRAIVQLSADYLTDADETLRRLRGPIEPLLSTPIGAAYRFAGLLQQIRTHHDSDAAASANGLLEDLRPLGVDAGYGHALLALSFYRLAGGEAPDPGHRGRAEHWWSLATTLLPAATLVERYNELAPLADQFTATPSPLDGHAATERA